MWWFLLFSIASALRVPNYPFLTNTQWKNINHLIQNPQITPTMREQLNTAIYKRYQVWAFSKAAAFKRLHRHKCAHIPTEELQLYSIKGLSHAVKNYNGKGDFATYAEHYVRGELYCGLTQLYPLSSIPASVRKTANPMRIPIDFYKPLTHKESSPSIPHLQTQMEKDEYRDFWERRISDFSPLEKRVFQYKYDLYLNPIRTNKETGELMGYSEEWARQIFLRALPKILI
jgi:RNA polymerase sigma factor (sigma-70 family)